MEAIECASLLPGSFEMGEDRSYLQERKVCMTLTKPFKVMTTLVTQKLWLEVMSEPSWNKLEDKKRFRAGPNMPAVGMTLLEACRFAESISRRTGKYYRLPTEVEWEYAIRAGTSSLYFWENEPEQGHEFAWFRKSNMSDDDLHIRKVGLLKPNKWGLFDMAGNVCEWVLDLCRPEYGEVRINPSHFPEHGTDFVSLAGWRGIVRNGSFSSHWSRIGSSHRSHVDVSLRSVEVGFRLVHDVENNVRADQLEVLECPWSADSTTLPMFVFWDLLSDSWPADPGEQVDIFWSYLRQLDSLCKSAKLTKSDSEIRDEMLQSDNLSRLLKTAEGVRPIFVRGQIPAEHANLLDQAIAKIRERLGSREGRE